ncbi:hypothetical protein AB6A40_010230 [Gnathostoma spinigerum]|uniref:N-terminal methionine N(alpha)-acetyltransferase NatC n=1 Tax=Gnathostoma spinigerum TaxID=75299 RepID=A0ABD6EVY7_9BILA
MEMVDIITDTIVRLKHCLNIIDAATNSSTTDDHCRSTTNESVFDHGVATTYPVPTFDRSSYRASQIRIIEYENELQMHDIMQLVMRALSEPYSIYTYRYFIHNWPKLCLLAWDCVTQSYVGTIVCKLDDAHRQNRRRGYIAMLVVDGSCRRLGVGTRLVQKAIDNMRAMKCDEVVLETEVTNQDAIRLYSNLGFIRDKRLFRYYLNGVDAFRLKLFFTSPVLANDTTTQNAQEVM